MPGGTGTGKTYPHCEILNVEYNCKVLIIKALNSCKQINKAAIKLGISERMLHIYLNKYSIRKKQGQYETVTKKVVAQPAV